MALVTGREGGYKMVGGQVKFYPYKKCGGGGRAETVLAMLRGGTQSFGVVLMRELESFSHTEGRWVLKDQINSARLRPKKVYIFF